MDLSLIETIDRREGWASPRFRKLIGMSVCPSPEGGGHFVVRFSVLIGLSFEIPC